MHSKQKQKTVTLSPRELLPAAGRWLRAAVSVIFLVALLLPQMTYADALPKSIHYQGRIREKTSGELVTGSVVVRFDLYNKLLAPDNQSMTYSTTVSANNGLFDVEIPIDMSLVDFNEGPYYMRVFVGGEDLGEEPIFGVPYALNAETLGGFTAEDLVNGNFIHNQFGSAQSSANFWVDGQGRIGNNFRIDGTLNIAGSIFDPNDTTVTIGENLQIAGDATVTGNFYVGASAASTNDIYIADRILDWDNVAYYADFSADSNFSGLIVGGGSSSNWATLDIGGTNSINAAGSIYSYNSVCVGNTSENCNGTGGTVIGKTTAGAAINITHTGNSFINTGFLGVGTATPSARLDVQGGNLNVSGYAQVGAEGVQFTGSVVPPSAAVGEGRLYYNSTDDLYHYWNGTEWVALRSLWVDEVGYIWPNTATDNFRITDGGSLGVGTGAPGAMVDIASGTGSGLRVINSDGTHTWLNYNGTNDNYIRGRNTYLGDGPADTDDFYIADRIIDWDSTGYYLDPSSVSRMNEVHANRVYGFSDIRSPIYYDYNNTVYYGDFAGDSNLSGLRLGGGSDTNWATLDVGGTSSINAAGSIFSYDSLCVGNNSGSCDSTSGTVIGKTNTTAGVNITHTGSSFFNSGNVGIGTTAPSTTLDVTGTGRFSAALAANGGITFDNATDTLGAHTLAGTVNANTNILTNIGNAGTDFIAGTGALTLAGTLTLSNNTITCTGCVDTTDILDNTITALDIAPDAVQDSELMNGGTWTTTANLNITGGNLANGFSVDGTTLSVDALNNRVGIGTASPGAKLDVAGDVFANGLVRVDGNSSSFRAYTASSPSVYNMNLQTNYNYANPVLLTGYNGYEIISQRNGGEVCIGCGSGNVGVNVVDPEERLDVNGDIGVYGGSVKLEIPVTAGGWARGLNFYQDKTGGVELAGVGLYGSATTPQRLYMGFGDNPYGSTLGIQIKSDGNVGIGTANPGAKLDVQGGNLNVSGYGQFGSAGVQFTPTATNPTGMVAADEGRIIYNGTDDRYYYWDGTQWIGINSIWKDEAGYIWPLTANNNFRITDTGRLGINNASPQTELHVGGNIAATGWVGAGCEGACETAGGYSLLYANGTIRNTGYTYSSDYVRADGGFQVDGQTVIDNVGQFAYLRTGGATGRIGQVNTSGTGIDALNNGDWDLLVYEGQSYTSNLVMGYNGSATLSTYDLNESLTVDPNGTGNVIMVPDATDGNVGIGTTAPLSKLHVQGDNASIRLQANTTNIADSGSIQFLENATAGMKLSYDGSGPGAGSLRIQDNGVADLMTVTRAGDVGIGTITPATRLDVSGTGRFSGALAANGGITFDQATDTVGSHTWAGTVNANNNILTDIGNAGTDFIAGTGALTLAGTLTLSNNTIACTGCVETTDILDNTITATDIAPDAVQDSELMNGGTWTTTSNLNITGGNLANGFSVDGTTLSVDALNNRVGVGTAVPGTTFDVSGNGRFATSLTAREIGVSNTDSTTGRGISLYGGPSTGVPTYGMMFAGTGTFGGHGSVASNDWATYLTTSNTLARGWIFRRGSTNVASISGHGNLSANGTISSVGQHYAAGSLVWNAGNDGSGSGLDADLVDGVQPDLTPDTIADDGVISTGETNFTNQNLYTTSGPTFNTVYTPSWFRSTGASGWYNETYGGGIFMDQANYVRVYNGKGLTVPGSVGIGTTAPANKLVVQGGHGDTQLRLFSDANNQGVDGANTATLQMWASEPGHTWTGAGIGNNVYNTTNFPRITATRGGSFMRLLDNTITLNTVNSSGTNYQALILDSSNNVGIQGDLYDISHATLDVADNLSVTGNISATGTVSSTGQHYAAGSLVWNEGNDGLGSGLYADYSYWLKPMANYAITDATLPDASLVNKSARLDFINTFSGGGQVYRTVLSLAGANSNGIGQLAFPYNSGATAPLYWRSENYTADTWGPWAEIWDSVNDGSGSGLDADLIDGVQPDLTPDTIADDGVISTGETNFTNQNLYTTSGPTFADVYVNGWFRNNNVDQGLYNSTTGKHFYSGDTSYWVMNSGNGLQLRNAHEGTVTGYLYWNGTAGSNNFGLLSPSGNWRVRTDNSNVELYGGAYMGTAYANILYDRDNTGYYLDPASTSNLNSVNLITADAHNVTGDLTFTNYGIGVVGNYASTRYQNLFSMGASYTPADDGTSLDNMYGVAWTHSNVGGESIAGLGHQALFVSAGDTRSAVGDGIWTKYNVTGNRFVDQNDPNYYVDPASTSELNQITGATNARWGNPDTWTNRTAITSNTNYWTGSQGWGANNLNTEVPGWGSTFFDVWNNPVGQPAGTSHWQGVQAFHQWDGTTGHGSQLLFGSPMMNGTMMIRSIWGGAWGSWYKVWSEGNDGSGSGLDADLLDGWDRDVVRANALSFTHVGGTGAAGGYNVDTMLASGGMTSQYGSGSYWAGTPAGMSYGSVLALKSTYGTSLSGQLAWDVNHNSATSTRRLWFRAANNLGFQNDWGQVWHSGSDGSGSGLDADLVDGVQPDLTPDTIADDGVISTGETNFTNQNLYTTSGPTFNTVYVPNWFRNTGSSGLYNETYGRGIYAAEAGGNTYGSYTTYDGGRNGWAGWGIGSRYVFMSNSGTTVGIHDNSYGWVMHDDGTNLNLYNRGTMRLSTRNWGVYIPDNVGIGEASPSAKLDVVGNLELNGALYTPAGQAWSGDPGAGFGKIQYHSNRWYIVGDSASNRIVQFRRNGTDLSYIANNGKFVGTATYADDSNLLDGIDSTGFARAFGTQGFGSSTTTDAFISELSAKGMLGYGTSTAKGSWSYAGNSDISDTGFGAFELAGTALQTWNDGSNRTVLAIRPTTGAGGGQVLVYNSQGSGYAPGWRQLWTNTTDGSGSGLDADLVDGVQPDLTPDTIADDGVISTGETNFTNQSLYTTSGPTFANVYANGWFRNNRTNEGLYNQANGNHWYSDGTYWKAGNNNSGVGGIQLRYGHEGALKGYVYWDGTGFGLLNNQGNWMLYSPTNSTNVYFPAWGNWITSAATHRAEGTNYVDYARFVFNNGVYSGSGWVEPSDLGVRYANRAGMLDGNASNPNNSHPGYGAKVFYSWNTGQANNDTGGYSNGITIGSHPGDQSYGFQLVQNMWDDSLYMRRYNGGWQSWRTLCDNRNNCNYRQFDTWQYNHYSGTDGAEYATIFRDSNDGNWYVDPASTSRTNRFDFRYGYDVDNTGYYIDLDNTTRANEIQANRVYGFTDIRSPIFYDYNDTGYYVDPAGNSRFGGWLYFGRSSGQGIEFTGTGTLNSTGGNNANGRLHISADETIYLLPRNGNNVVISNSWGGSGSLTLVNTLNFNSRLQIYDNGDWGHITNASNDRIYTNNRLGIKGQLALGGDPWGWGGLCRTCADSISGWPNLWMIATSDLFAVSVNTGQMYWRANDGNNRMRLQYSNGDLFIDGTYRCGNADIAEVIAGDATGYERDLEPGDVVVIHPDKDETVGFTSLPYSTSVAGVVSTAPGLLLGEEGGVNREETSQELVESIRVNGGVPMALAGRVPTKVTAENGSIRRGDLLVTASTPGYAMKADPDQVTVGMIVGKAMGELVEGEGVIVVLVNLQ